MHILITEVHTPMLKNFTKVQSTLYGVAELQSVILFFVIMPAKRHKHDGVTVSSWSEVDCFSDPCLELTTLPHNPEIP